MPKRYLLIYDISKQRTRHQLVKLLNNYGNRVQKSAFEFYIIESRMLDLLKALRKINCGERDSIRIYKLFNDNHLFWSNEEPSAKDQRNIIF